MILLHQNSVCVKTQCLLKQLEKAKQSDTKWYTILMVGDFKAEVQDAT